LKLPSVLQRLPVRILSAGAIVCLFMSVSCSMLQYKPTRLEKETGLFYTDQIEMAGEQANRAFGSLNGSFPTHATGGTWVDDDQFFWASGYYPGLLWLLYEGIGDTTAVNLAATWMPGLEPLKEKPDQAGLGMVFFPSYVRAYKITGNKYYRQVALDAAEQLDSRFAPAGFFPAWGEAGDMVLGRRLAIESLMDLDLLYWASEASGNTEFARHASNHATFVIARLIDGDGRILHLADFDPTTGAIYGDRTPELAGNEKYSTKGYKASSVWAQGQAWAIYGLTSAYAHEQNTLFLNAALRAADYFVANLPEDGVPVWDFELPAGADRQKDTAAAAVAAAGLLKLAQMTPTPSDRVRYRDVAYKIISTLSGAYLTKGGHGILTDAVYGKQSGKGMAGSTSWADYYYIESLLLLRDIGA
jgi:unsaturated chondroitin disaccharide hydrolase